jgi:DNA-binding response OmpR family regulator
MSNALRPTLLVVDDDAVLLSVVARRLRREGFEVRTAVSGQGAIAALEGIWPSLLIIDLMMPGMDGFELARRVKRLADLPIIVLSAVDASEAKVAALQQYAEDYVIKPFDPDELVARVQRVLRRSASGSPSATLGNGEVEIDLVMKRLTTAAGTHSLTPVETRLLQLFMSTPDRIIPTEMILDRVWSEADGADPSYVWVTVRRLRRKLEPDPDRPRYLLTERGIGYRLNSSGR